MNARLTAPDRLARLLAIIPYVAGRGPVPLDEVATRFSYPRADLVRDLTGVVGYVGVAPFTKETVLQVGIMAVVPIAPLVLTLIPLEELLKRLFTILL